MMKWLSALLVFFYVSLLNAQPPPPNPPPPPFMGNLLPIVLVNNSTLLDDQVYITITGRSTTIAPPNNQVFVQFDANGVGTLVSAVPTPPSPPAPPPPPIYSYKLSQFPLTPAGQRVIYLPNIDSSAIFFSLGVPLTFPVNSDPYPPVSGSIISIVQPSFTNPTDPNYNIIFDIFEFVYLPTAPSIFADATAVSFFAIPLYGYISTPDLGTLANTGLYQSRNSIFSSVANYFTLYTQAMAERNQWFNLFTIGTFPPPLSFPVLLRILSPGKAMTAPNPIVPSQMIMDPNYLDNQSAYGYSYIADIWTRTLPLSFYKANPLTMTIPNGETYTGMVSNTGPDFNTLTLTSNLNTVRFAAPTTMPVPPNFTTTADIFSGVTFPVLLDTSPGQADSVQLSKLLQESIIAGLVPTTDPLNGNPASPDFLAIKQPQFYQTNSNLTPPGPSTGPWYDLYSKSLHALGYIYTFAFDEPLWPQVQISSQNFLTNQTYLAVTIGPIDEVQASTTTLTSAVVGQTATVNASVSGSPGLAPPAGTVTFILDGVLQSTVPLVNGQAVFQFANLSPGNHIVMANYSGDTIYLPSSASITIFISSITPIIPSEPSDPSDPSDPSGFPFAPLDVVAPPRNLHVSQIKNQFSTQTEWVNVITWKAPTTGSTPVFYKIYHDRKLKDFVASVKGDRFKYEDHNCRKGHARYFIVSVDALGNTSVPAKVVLRE